MDNAMNTADKVEQIMNRVRDLEERLSAWKSLATRDHSVKESALLNREVEDELTQVRAPLPYREHLDEFRKALDSAIGDDALIQQLYEEIFLRTTV